MTKNRERRRRFAGWAIPLAYALTAWVVGFELPRLEHAWAPHLVASISANAATAMCSAIASGMLALTGIVFSLTFVMVQFSATAYSPRLVLWMARDPVMTHALGIFIATFLYALLLLAWVDRGTEGRVPFFSGWLVLALLIASMAMFVALIDRVGRLQVNRMLTFTSDHGRASLTELYAALEPQAATATPEHVDLRRLPLTQVVAHRGPPQVVQALDLPGLVAIAERADAVIEATAAVGDTVVELSPLLRVYRAGHPLDEARLRRAVELGDERTFEQDPKYALRLVVDIAIKALSPAINDPTTAVQALDQIEDLLLRLGRCNLDIGVRRDARGAPRLVVPFPDWSDFLRLALDEIRLYGAGSVQVMRRLKALIQNLRSVLPPERHAALGYWDERLAESISRSFADAEDQRDASEADRQGLGIGDATAPAAPPDAGLPPSRA